MKVFFFTDPRNVRQSISCVASNNQRLKHKLTLASVGLALDAGHDVTACTVAQAVAQN